MSKSLDLASLFQEEGPRLLRFLRRFGSNISPEDIRQEAFAKLHAARAEEIISPRAYLFRTARNLAIDHARRKAASPVRAVRDLDSLEASAAELSPEEQALADERLRGVEAALQSLSEEERTALLLRKIEGLSPHQIGARLGLSTRQVQRLIARALAQCHAHVESGELRC